MSNKAWKNFFGSRLFLAGAFALSIFLLMVYARSFYQDYEIKQEIKRMQGEVKRLEAKKLESLEVLKYVKSAAFLEAKAHTDFNLVKPGEHVALIQEKVVQNQGRQALEKVVESGNVINPIKWLKIFFK